MHIILSVLHWWGEAWGSDDDGPTPTHDQRRRNYTTTHWAIHHHLLPFVVVVRSFVVLSTAVVVLAAARPLSPTRRRSSVWQHRPPLTRRRPRARRHNIRGPCSHSQRSFLLAAYLASPATPRRSRFVTRLQPTPRRGRCLLAGPRGGRGGAALRGVLPSRKSCSVLAPALAGWSSCEAGRFAGCCCGARRGPVGQTARRPAERNPVTEPAPGHAPLPSSRVGVRLRRGEMHFPTPSSSCRRCKSRQKRSILAADGSRPTQK